jgi:hypothetical protein
VQLPWQDDVTEVTLDLQQQQQQFDYDSAQHVVYRLELLEKPTAAAE